MTSLPTSSSFAFSSSASASSSSISCGNPMGGPLVKELPEVEAGAVFDVTMELIAPEEEGEYESCWQWSSSSSSSSSFVEEGSSVEDGEEEEKEEEEQNVMLWVRI